MKMVLPIRLVGVALAVMLLGAPTNTYAQDDDAEVTRMAKEHYKAGLDAYKNGKYDVAIKELKKAYLLKRLPALLLNIGATYRKMGDLDLALHFYKKYLDEAPGDAKDRNEVEKTIADIKVEKEGGGAPPPQGDGKEPEARPEPPRPVQMPQEWSHTVIDAAPPDTPLDVRVTTPVMKGVKVYVYYRGAGEEEFKPVLMKRRGTEKIGRIPANAVSGKAIQYYIEARDPAGTVVKSSGSTTNPNIVMVDPNAAPQMVASVEERGSGREAEPQGDQGYEPRDERPTPGKRGRNLDDESAPVSGTYGDDDRPRRATKTGGTKKYGGLFYGGVGLMAAGAAALGVGVTGLILAGQRADEVGAFSRDPKDADGNKIFFNNDDIASMNGFKQMAAIESEGKMWNAIGIAGTVVGGVAIVGGAALMLTDQVFLKMRTERPRRRRRPRPPVDEEAKLEQPRGRKSVTPWYIAPAAAPGYAGVGGGFQF